MEAPFKKKQKHFLVYKNRWKKSLWDHFSTVSLNSSMHSEHKTGMLYYLVTHISCLGYME